jgi:glycosyltransferase involved in cell wall biosynthesis
VSRVLYITRNGLCEPLGQSQVLAYLRGLADEHEITVISFEKPEDIADSAGLARVRAQCEAHGIRWLPRRFRPGPRGLAPAWAVLLLLLQTLREVRAGRAELVHARSYLPAAVALLAHRLTGAPFVFDMRALWPEELITAGRLRRGSRLHRALMAAERECLRRAAAVVTLTEASAAHLRAAYPEDLAGQRIAVIPTCADLDRFAPGPAPEGPPVWGCIGSVLSGWFRTDWLRALFETVADRDAEAHFEIVTREDPAAVRAALDPPESVARRLSIYAKPPHEVEEAIRRQSVSAMFYAGGETSELGRAPTRLGEILGCGIPVVANAGVGDVARILETHQAGVIARDGSAEAMGEALDALDALRADPGLPDRCRRTAEALFSLEKGTEAYRGLYREVAGAPPASPAAEETTRSAG